MIENVNKDLPFVIEMNKFIGLPEDDIENHKEIYADGNFIGRYISARHYLFQDYGESFNTETKSWDTEFNDEIIKLEEQKRDMKKRICEKEEFNIKKIKTIQNKLIFLDKVREKIGCTDRLKIEEFNVMDSKDAEEFHSEYKAVFTDRSNKKDNPFETKHGIQVLINKIYKNVFGATPFDSVSTSINGKTIKEYKNGSRELMNNYSNMYEVYQKARSEYEKKLIQKQIDGEKIDNMKEFLFID